MPIKAKENNDELESDVFDSDLARARDRDAEGPPPYQRKFNDRPDSYCCDSLKYAVEDHLGYIQYDARFREFVFVHPSGKFVMANVIYCPWCGTKTNTLRDLYAKKMDEYIDAGLLKWVEVIEYWPILALDLSQEKTMRLIEAERAKKKEITGNN